MEIGLGIAFFLPLTITLLLFTFKLLYAYPFRVRILIKNFFKSSLKISYYQFYLRKYQQAIVNDQYINIDHPITQKIYIYKCFKINTPIQSNIKNTISFISQKENPNLWLPPKP